MPKPAKPLMPQGKPTLPKINFCLTPDLVLPRPAEPPDPVATAIAGWSAAIMLLGGAAAALL